MSLESSARGRCKSSPSHDLCFIHGSLRISEGRLHFRGRTTRPGQYLRRVKDSCRSSLVYILHRAWTSSGCREDLQLLRSARDTSLRYSRNHLAILEGDEGPVGKP